jgi:hypothetical protein
MVIGYDGLGGSRGGGSASNDGSGSGWKDQSVAVVAGGPAGPAGEQWISFVTGSVNMQIRDGGTSYQSNTLTITWWQRREDHRGPVRTSEDQRGPAGPAGEQ